MINGLGCVEWEFTLFPCAKERRQFHLPPVVEERCFLGLAAVPFLHKILASALRGYENGGCLWVIKDIFALFWTDVVLD